jgi:hypothetical protein
MCPQNIQWNPVGLEIRFNQVLLYTDGGNWLDKSTNTAKND